MGARNVLLRNTKTLLIIDFQGFLFYSTPKKTKENRAEFSIHGSREQINLPIIKEEMTDNEIDSLPFSDGIKKLSIKKGIAIDSVKGYITKVVSLYRELKATEIVSHPDLGEFIRFKLSDQTELIYKERLGKVYHKYWKEYFRTASSIGDSWYMKK